MPAFQRLCKTNDRKIESNRQRVQLRYATCCCHPYSNAFLQPHYCNHNYPKFNILFSYLHCVVYNPSFPKFPAQSTHNFFSYSFTTIHHHCSNLLDIRPSSSYITLLNLSMSTCSLSVFFKTTTTL